MNRLWSPLSKLAPNAEDKDEEYKHGLVAIRDKAFIIANSIYQIANISTVSVADLSTTKPIPAPFWLLLLGGLFLFFQPTQELQGVGLALLIGSGYYFYRYWKSKHVSRFALSILMNAGNTLSIFSDDLPLLKSIAFGLFQVMNYDEVRNLTFNLDNRQIVNGVSDSVVNLGQVSGDIVNNV